MYKYGLSPCLWTRWFSGCSYVIAGSAYLALCTPFRCPGDIWPGAGGREVDGSKTEGAGGASCVDGTYVCGCTTSGSGSGSGSDPVSDPVSG